MQRVALWRTGQSCGKRFAGWGCRRTEATEGAGFPLRSGRRTRWGVKNASRWKTLEILDGGWLLFESYSARHFFWLAGMALVPRGTIRVLRWLMGCSTWNKERNSIARFVCVGWALGGSHPIVQ